MWLRIGVIKEIAKFLNISKLLMHFFTFNTSVNITQIKIHSESKINIKILNMFLKNLHKNMLKKQFLSKFHFSPLNRQHNFNSLKAKYTEYNEF